MRIKREYRTASKEVYNKFCLKYPEVKISFIKWKEAIYSFNYLIRDYIVETGEKVKLQGGFGPLAISKKKSKTYNEFNGKQMINLATDWKKTKLAGKKIYHLNQHTDGYRCKWFWFVREARFYMSDIWVFKPARLSSRKVTAELNRPDSLAIEFYKKWDR